MAKIDPISEQVRQALADAGELGLTRYRVAELAGLTQSAMTRFANGGGGVELATLDRIAGVLGLTLKMNRAHVRALVKGAPKRGRPLKAKTKRQDAPPVRRRGQG